MLIRHDSSHLLYFTVRLFFISSFPLPLHQLCYIRHHTNYPAFIPGPSFFDSFQYNFAHLPFAFSLSILFKLRLSESPQPIVLHLLFSTCLTKFINLATIFLWWCPIKFSVSKLVLFAYLCWPCELQRYFFNSSLRFP